MYRDDLAAAHARLDDLQRELTEASSQATQDQQRIAQLTAQLAAAREALARMGQVMPAYVGPQYIYPSRATTVLVLGILSLAVCAVMGPIAWSMGNEELRRIDVGQTPGIARSSAVAGRICGIVGTSILILSGFGFLIGLAAGLH
jgi:hypothetical protein